MNTHKLLPFISLLIITTSHHAYSMESKTKKHPLTRYTKELTTFIGKPLCVKFLPNNTVFLSGARGFMLYNHETKEELIKQFRDYGFLDVAVNANKTKIALSADKKLSIYNTETGKKEWEKDTSYLYFPITFNWQNNNEIISHAPHNNKIILISQTSHIEHSVPSTKSGQISSYPQFSEIIYPSENSFTLFDCNAGLANIEFFGDNFLSSECSYDGRFIAANYKNKGCYLLNGYFSHPVNIDTPTIKLCSVSKKKFLQAHYGAMAFHQNNTLTLLSHNNILEFWHSSTGTLVKEIDLNYFDTLHINGTMQKRLDLSPEGNHILVALQNKCLILPMPFEAFYTPDIPPLLFKLYCLLCNYTEIILPRDIIHVILNHYITKIKKLPSTF